MMNNAYEMIETPHYQELPHFHRIHYDMEENIKDLYLMNSARLPKKRQSASLQ